MKSYIINNEKGNYLGTVTLPKSCNLLDVRLRVEEAFGKKQKYQEPILRI